MEGSESPARPLRVLVVDDDPAVRLLCGTCFRLEGCEVIEAGDGQEGLERAFAEKPDVVLLDISMPILDGFGVAAALRGDERTQRLPFVFLSGETDPKLEALAYEVGAQGFLSKPFDPAAVVEFVKSMLSQLLPDPETAPATGGHAF